MTELQDLWADVKATRRSQVASGVDRATMEAFCSQARAGGDLVVVEAFDPIAAENGLGPLGSIVERVLAELGPHSLEDAGTWVQPAIDDLTGRSASRRDLAEIYSAVGAVLMRAAEIRGVVIVLDGIEWASSAIRGLLGYLDGGLDATVAVLCVHGAGTRDLSPEEHLRLANELEATDRALREPELVGAHLAYASATTEGDPEIGRRAALWFARAAKAAVDRSDMTSATRLYPRAIALLPPGDPHRLRCMVDSCEALLATGQVGEIVALARNGIVEARREDDGCMAARLRVWQLMVDDSTATDDPPVAELQSLEATLSECSDEAGVAHTAEALAHIAWITGDADEAMARMQRGLVSSYRANERVPLSRMAVAYLSILVAGPMPVDEAIRKCEAVGPIAQRSALVEISLKANAALLFAMGDGVTVARHSLEDAESIQAALGQPPWVARVPRIAGSIELMDGDPVRAIERAGRDLDFLLQGAHPAGIDAGVIVARALCDAGRHDEAVELTRRLLDSLAAVSTSEAPEITDGEIEAVRARALAAVGRPGDATASIARSDASPPSHVRFVQRADRLLDTALACSMLDELGDARRRSEEALRLYREKGARLPALRARSVLESTTKNL